MHSFFDFINFTHRGGIYFGDSDDGFAVYVIDLPWKVGKDGWYWAVYLVAKCIRQCQVLNWPVTELSSICNWPAVLAPE